MQESIKFQVYCDDIYFLATSLLWHLSVQLFSSSLQPDRLRTLKFSCITLLPRILEFDKNLIRQSWIDRWRCLPFKVLLLSSTLPCCLSSHSGLASQTARHSSLEFHLFNTLILVNLVFMAILSIRRSQQHLREYCKLLLSLMMAMIQRKNCCSDSV